MIRYLKSQILVVGLLLITTISTVQALEILHFVEAKDYARVMEDATGVKMTDDGIVYVSSAEKSTLLKITDGKIEASSLSPSVFDRGDLGGVDMLADGFLVFINEDRGQVAVTNPQLELVERFSQSGSDAGELDDPGPVAVSSNNKIYVGDVKNKQISVFNRQGLFLYTIGRQGASGDLRKPSHVSSVGVMSFSFAPGPTG